MTVQIQEFHWSLRKLKVDSSKWWRKHRKTFRHCNSWDNFQHWIWFPTYTLDSSDIHQLRPRLDSPCSDLRMLMVSGRRQRYSHEPISSQTTSHLESPDSLRASCPCLPLSWDEGWRTTMRRLALVSLMINTHTHTHIINQIQIWDGRTDGRTDRRMDGYMYLRSLSWHNLTMCRLLFHFPLQEETQFRRLSGHQTSTWST